MIQFAQPPGREAEAVGAQVPTASARRHARQRRFLVGVKAGSGCVDCGYADNVNALEFDHVRGPSKPGGVPAQKNWPSLLRELDVCDVVCANCHAIRTAVRGGYAW